ncbi:MAG: protein kinase [Anaerolineales bacterium]|nr:protein kinase [Anaerolineales bacterium]
MERFCERCERISVDGHLWCQEIDCPAEEGFPVFSYGDYLGDLKITKLITVWRTAALYEAQRGDQTVWVKVAHAGPECEERLKREAVLLAMLNPTRTGGLNDWRAKPRPLLPVWLPPYPVPSKRPYGEITFDGETKIYSVCEPLPGTLLSDLLLTNPHVWHYEAAWVTTTLAEALKPLAARNLLHLSLTPDRVIVEIDQDGHWRATLLDLGWLLNAAGTAAGAEAAALKELAERSEPAYTAPEVLARNGAASALTPAADVYALGLLFYEMLSGHPAFEPKLRRDELVSRAVVQTRAAPPIDRPELIQAGVIKVLEKAIAPVAAERYATLQEFERAITAIYGPQPKEKRPLPRRTIVLLWMLVALLAVTLCVTSFLLAQVWLGS